MAPIGDFLYTISPWYEPVQGSTSMASGYCGKCAVWWMGGHSCPEPVAGMSPEFEARLREVVREVIEQYGPALRRLADDD